MNGSSPEAGVAYHVSRNGAVSGPFSGAELRAGVMTGRFALSDFVHATGQTEWQPLGQFLDGLGKTQEGPKAAGAAEVPEWSSIGKSAWARLRLSMAERGLATGAVFLLLGLVALALAHWPVFFWAPWLGIAAVTALVLLLRGQKATGVILLLAVILLPWTLLRFMSKLPAGKAESVAENTPVEPWPVETSRPKTPAIAAATPEAIPAPVVRPAASLPVATPAPVPAPAPAVVAAQTVPATPAAPTPVPESLLTKAGKWADSVGAFFNRAKEALPNFPDAGKPDAKAANGDAAAAGATSLDPVQARADAIVVVRNGAVSVGNAFACRMGDKTWLFSNTHILAAARQLTYTQVTGAPVIPGPAEVAPGPDLVRFPLDKSPAHVFEAVTNFESTVQIGDGVEVMGNSAAGGVVISWNGVVTGIGPDRVEVSAGFLPANSGGPVIHLKSGKVIGIANYFRRPYEEFGDNGRVDGSTMGRHFAFRIDRPQVWQPVNWTEFYAEADRLEQISKLTEDIYNLRDSIAKQREPYCNTDTLRVAAQEWRQKMSQRGLSGVDRVNAGQTFFNAIRFMTKADVNALEGHLTYAYFRDQLVAEKKIRDRLSQQIDVLLEPGTHKPY